MARKNTSPVLFMMCLFILLVEKISGSKYIQARKRLTAVPANIPVNVTHINLEYNDITRIHEGDFSGLTQLTWLKLYHNDLNIISPIAFKDTQITYLYLSNNLLVAVPDLCIIAETLESLHIRKNMIDIVDPTSINCLVKLKDLRLGSNPFSVLPLDTFAGLVKLKLLYLEETNLNSPPVLGNIHLNKLMLEDTQLTSFPDPSLMNSTINRVYLKSTDLVCDSSIAWMKMSVVRGWPYIIEVDDKPCKNPIGLVEATWTNLTISDLCSGSCTKSSFARQIYDSIYTSEPIHQIELTYPSSHLDMADLTDLYVTTCLTLPHTHGHFMYNKLKVRFSNPQKKDKIITAEFQTSPDDGLSMKRCGDVLPPVRAVVEFCDELKPDSNYACARPEQSYHTFDCEVFCNEYSPAISFMCQCPALFCPSMYLMLSTAAPICEISVWV